jgi:hypothetical protein
MMQAKKKLKCVPILLCVLSMYALVFVYNVSADRRTGPVPLIDVPENLYHILSQNCAFFDYYTLKKCYTDRYD